MTAALVTQCVPTHPQATHQHSLSGVKKPISGPVSATSHHQPPATQNSHFLVWIISPSSPHNLITTHHLLMNGHSRARARSGHSASCQAAVTRGQAANIQIYSPLCLLSPSAARLWSVCNAEHEEQFISQH